MLYDAYCRGIAFLVFAVQEETDMQSFMRRSFLLDTPEALISQIYTESRVESDNI